MQIEERVGNPRGIFSAWKGSFSKSRPRKHGISKVTSAPNPPQRKTFLEKLLLAQLFQCRIMLNVNCCKMSEIEFSIQQLKFHRAGNFQFIMRRASLGLIFVEWRGIDCHAQIELAAHNCFVFNPTEVHSEVLNRKVKIELKFPTLASAHFPSN